MRHPILTLTLTLTLTLMLPVMWGAVAGPASAQLLDLNQDAAIKAEQEAFAAEHHNHNMEVWVGRHATQAGNNWALPDTLGGFRATAGTAMAWGDTGKIIGSADTPFRAGNKKFDLHRAFLTQTSSDSLYAARIIFGTTNASAAVAAKQYTVFYFKSDSANPQTSAGVPFDLVMMQVDDGTKVWMQIKCVANSATARLFFGYHEYPR